MGSFMQLPVGLGVGIGSFRGYARCKAEFDSSRMQAFV